MNTATFCKVLTFLEAVRLAAAHNAVPHGIGDISDFKVVSKREAAWRQVSILADELKLELEKEAVS